MAPSRNGPSDLDVGVQPLHTDGAQHGGEQIFNNPRPRGRPRDYPALPPPIANLGTSYSYEYDQGVLYLCQCGPLDAAQLQMWSESTLHGTYYFKRGHWNELVRNPAYQVYAISWAPSLDVARHQIIGLAILGRHTTLFNLYLDPHWRSQGIGSIVVRTLDPEVIRSKTDEKTGDPTPFYERLGYKVIQERQGKNSNIAVMQRILPQEGGPW